MNGQATIGGSPSLAVHRDLGLHHVARNATIWAGKKWVGRESAPVTLHSIEEPVGSTSAVAPLAATTAAKGQQSG